MGYLCARIGHTQLFLWLMYSEIVSLLPITVQGGITLALLIVFFIHAVIAIIDYIYRTCPV